MAIYRIYRIGLNRELGSFSIKEAAIVAADKLKAEDGGNYTVTEEVDIYTTQTLDEAINGICKILS